MPLSYKALGFSSIYTFKQANSWLSFEWKLTEHIFCLFNVLQKETLFACV